MFRPRWYAFTAALLACSALPAPAISLSGAASITTIAVNSGTIFKMVRHPKRESKKVAKAVKDGMKGKN